MTLNLAETSVAKSRPSVPYGANFFVNDIFVSIAQMLFLCLVLYLDGVMPGWLNLQSQELGFDSWQFHFCVTKL